MRNLLLLTIALTFSIATGAQELPDSPKPKPVTQERPATRAFWIASAVMGASGAAPIIGGNICRDNNGVEPCTQHYGAYHIWSTVTATASATLGPALFYGCRKEYANSRWCWMIPGLVIGGNVGWGIHEARIDRPEIEGHRFQRRK